MRFLATITTMLAIAGAAWAGELSVNQRLIVACHRVDVAAAVTAIRDGADVNGLGMGTESVVPIKEY